MQMPWGGRQKIEYQPPKKAMEHVVGQIYHQYDFPLTQEDMAMRDSVYIVSLWRDDSTVRYERHRSRRKESNNEVHDIIKFHTGIDQDSSKALTQHLQYLNSIGYDKVRQPDGSTWIQPIWLEIMSPGGSVAAGVEMRSVVEASRRPVIPILSGMCASAATFLFTANQNYRLMQSASILLIHQMSQGTGYGRSLKICEWENEVKNMDVWQKQIVQFYYGLKRPREYIAKRFGPTSKAEKGDGERDAVMVKPYTRDRTPAETTKEDVVDEERYREKIAQCMNGIDAYMPCNEALRYGLATALFTSWKELENDESSPAFHVKPPPPPPPPAPSPPGPPTPRPARDGGDDQRRVVIRVVEDE